MFAEIVAVPVKLELRRVKLKKGDQILMGNCRSKRSVPVDPEVSRAPLSSFQSQLIDTIQCYFRLWFKIQVIFYFKCYLIMLYHCNYLMLRLVN